MNANEYFIKFANKTDQITLYYTCNDVDVPCCFKYNLLSLDLYLVYKLFIDSI